MNYTNYRWEKANPRKGDRYYYKRTVTWENQPMHWRKPEEQVIATVNYDSNSSSAHWGKWHVSFGAQSPGLARLRLQERDPFSSRDDAIAWATAMIRLEGL